MKRLSLFFFAIGLAGLTTLVAKLGFRQIAGQILGLGWVLAVACLVQLTSLLFDSWVLRACAGPPSPGSYWRFARAVISGHAVNILTPFSQIGEITKYDQLRTMLSSERAASALFLQNVMMFASGFGVVSVSAVSAATLPSLRMLRPGLWATAAVFGAISAATVVVIHRGPGATVLRWLSTLGNGYPRAQKLMSWLRRVEAESRTVAGDAPTMTLIWLVVMASRLSGLLEIGALMAAFGQPQGPVVLLFIMSGGQILSWATSFVPMQIGTGEGGLYVLFTVLGLPPPLGVTLELARKLRRLLVAVFGVSLLGVGLVLRGRARNASSSLTE